MAFAILLGEGNRSERKRKRRRREKRRRIRRRREGRGREGRGREGEKRLEGEGRHNKPFLVVVSLSPFLIFSTIYSQVTLAKHFLFEETETKNATKRIYFSTPSRGKS